MSEIKEKTDSVTHVEVKVLCLNCGKQFMSDKAISRPRCFNCMSFAVKPVDRWLSIMNSSFKDVSFEELNSFIKVYKFFRDNEVAEFKVKEKSFVNAFIKQYKKWMKKRSEKVE